LSHRAIGKKYPPIEYEVCREKIREYVDAVGELDAVHRDRDAARAAGFQTVVAPPMFAAVYSARALGAVIVDPEVAIDVGRMVHGAQEFSWGEFVYAGDTINTTSEFTDCFERLGTTFYVIESVSTNQHGAEVCRGIWTLIVRKDQWL
jgi:acyl dehydratase